MSEKENQLHQVVAVVGGQKKRTQTELTAIHRLSKVQGLFGGMVKTYQPYDDDDVVLPDESTKLQQHVKTQTDAVQSLLGALWQVVATQDLTNCGATADVVLDGVAVIQLPVTTLMWLEKQVGDLIAYVSDLPVLADDKDWTRNTMEGRWETDIVKTIKTKKTVKTHVQYEATKDHPAQVHTYNEDVPAGEWSTKHLSGAIPRSDHKAMMVRAVELQTAIRKARELANEQQIEEAPQFAGALLSYVFNGNLSQSKG